MTVSVDESSLVQRLEREGPLIVEEILKSATYTSTDLSLGVTALYAFIQANWLGPWDKNHNFPDPQREESLILLEYDGEKPYALVKYPWLLILAKNILSQSESSKWMLLRALYLNLSLLDNPAASLVQEIDSLINGNYEDAVQVYGPACLVEAAIIYQTCSNQRASELFLEQACQAYGFSFSLTGVLGKRMKFQENDIAQLVVRVETTNKDAKCSIFESAPVDVELQDDDILKKPVLNEVSMPLNGDGRIILLAHASHLFKFYAGESSLRAGLAALVDKVLESPGDWAPYSTGLFLRSVIEMGKSRYVERAALQFQALVDQTKITLQVGFEDRIKYFFACPFPSEWEIDRHQAKLFAGLGAFRTASEIFERRAMWDELASCLVQLGEKLRAESMLVEHLEKDPSNAKFLCILGDLREDPSLYEKAWEVSQNRCSRAMRSLGMHYIKTDRNPDAIACFENALKVNGLFDRIWFLLGCAAMQENDWKKALSAFSRTVSLDNDNSEAWNNLAAVHLHLENPEQALACLKEAGKRQFESEKIWSNVFRVSMSLGELHEAIAAYRRIAEIKQENVSLDYLSVIYEALQSAIDCMGIKDPFIVAAIRQIRSLLDEVVATYLSLDYKFWYSCAEFAKIAGQKTEEVAFYYKAYRCVVKLNLESDLEAVKIVTDCLQRIFDVETNLTTVAVDEEQTQLKGIVESTKKRMITNFSNTEQYHKLDSIFNHLNSVH